jgi:hypothetical protein
MIWDHRSRLENNKQVKYNIMAEVRRDADIKIIEAVKLHPILWDSRLDEYKLSERKPPIWLSIADEIGCSSG